MKGEGDEMESLREQLMPLEGKRRDGEHRARPGY